MRKNAASLAIMRSVLCGGLVAGQSDDPAMWSRLYSKARTIRQKHDAVMEMVALESSQLISVLEHALQDLIATEEAQELPSDQFLHNEASKAAVKALGDMDAITASPLIFMVVEIAGEPNLKAVAIEALGKIGAREYIDEITRILNNINLNYESADAERDGEVVALACIHALEAIADPISFHSLFLTSIGWYPKISKVKEAAVEAMAVIAPDPTAPLTDIIATESEFIVKLQALEFADISWAPSAGKSAVAIEALRQGLIVRAKSVIQARHLHRLRLLALDMLAKYPTTDMETSENIRELIGRNVPVNEKLGAVVALSVQRTEEATKVLIKLLEDQNDQRAGGSAPTDYRLIKATITALGNTRSQLGAEELTRVRFSDWTRDIERIAEEALQKLE